MQNKLTKIVATVSDLNCSSEFIQELYDNGMNVVRLNTAHQSFEDTLKVVRNIRKCSGRIGILVDTKGPEVRTSMTSEEIFLQRGDKIKVETKFSENSTKEKINVSYPKFVKEVPKGASILIDDGELELKVISKTDTHLSCKVMNNGAFKSKKSVNVPGI